MLDCPIFNRDTSMDNSEILNLVNKKAEELNEARIYFALKKMGVKPITRHSVKVLKHILAYNVLGLTIDGYVTIPMLQASLKAKSDVPIRVTCHILGDKKVLELKYLKRCSVQFGYKVSNVFLDAFKRRA